MAIETKMAFVTVNVPLPITPDNLAVMVTAPVETLVAKPEADIATTLVLDEDHTTEDVMSLVDPSR
jgi:hypothetical protein